MRNKDAELDEFARARLAYLTAGRAPLVSGPRRGLTDSGGPPPFWDSRPGPNQEDHEPFSEIPDSPEAHEPGADGGSGSGAVRRPVPPVPDEDETTPVEGPTALELRLASAPSGVQGAIAFARSHLAATAVVLLVGLVVTAAFLMRSRATQVELRPGDAVGAPLPTSGATATTAPATVRAATSGSAAATPTSARLEVHVLGAVARPGVVTLPGGARVQDALTAAGGLTGQASPAELNLAAPVADGDQLLIGTRAHPRGEIRHAGETVPVPSTGAGAGGSGSTASTGTSAGTGSPVVGTIDLNTATAEQLDQLPGVGPVTAQRILSWRSAHQRFSRVEELQEVDGIGPKTYAQLSSHVRV